MNAAEVAAINESEDTLVQFEGHIDGHAFFTLVGKSQKFFAIGKP